MQLRGKNQELRVYRKSLSRSMSLYRKEEEPLQPKCIQAFRVLCFSFSCITYNLCLQNLKNINLSDYLLDHNEYLLDFNLLKSPFRGVKP